MKWYRVEALLLKYVLSMRRNLDRLFDWLYFPAVGLFTWGFTTLYLEDVTQSSQFLRFFLGGFILWTVVQRTQNDIAIALLEDFWTDNIYNTFSSPVTTVELFLSTTIYAVGRAFGAFLVLFVLALGLYGFNVASIGLLALPLFVFALVVFGSGIGFLVAGLIYRFGTRIQVFAWSTAPILQPFSLVFYPRSALPDPFHTVSLALPTSYVFEGMRAAIETGAVPWRLLGLGFGTSCVALVVGFAVFHRLVEGARREGYLAQNM